jgi:biotin carboxyl carrier protein
MDSKPNIKSKKISGNSGNNNHTNGNNMVKYQTLDILGDKYTTLFTKKYENRKKWVKPNEKNICSFIPGTVTEIFIKAGQTMKKGDKLMIFEAMKMLNLVEMPVNGKIKKIHVSVGDKISKGTLMIEII